jgi:hypothetical protein
LIVGRTAMTTTEGTGTAVVTARQRTTAIGPGVYLTKQEVFAACQALADADRVLVAAGTIHQARALGDLFELLEDRMTLP